MLDSVKSYAGKVMYLYVSFTKEKLVLLKSYQVNSAMPSLLKDGSRLSGNAFMEELLRFIA